MRDIKIILVDANASNLPSLGLGYLAAVLRDWAKVKEVKIIQKKFNPNLVEAIVAENADLIGYISFTPFFKELMTIVREVKGRTNAYQIVGGPHITGIPESLPVEFALGVIGEGEKTICEIATLLQNSGQLLVDDLKKINGIVFRDGDQAVITEPRAPIGNLDELPMPARDLLDIDKFFPSTIGVFPLKDLNASGILTSRGCPFHCSFCQPSALNKYRACSAERVIMEIEELVNKYHVNFVQILEDQFLSNQKRFEKIAGEIIRKKLHKKAGFLICARAEQLIDENTCKLLKKMNVKVIGIGFESASDRILKYLKNDFCSTELNDRAAKMCHKYGLNIYGSFIFGSPDETMADMEKTYQFLKDNFISMVEIQTLTPLPGTKIWQYALDRGLVSANMDWSHLMLRINSDDKQPWLCEHVTKDEFMNFFDAKVRPLSWHYNQIMVEFNPLDYCHLSAWKKIKKNPKKYLSAVKHTWVYFWRHKIKKGLGNFPN